MNSLMLVRFLLFSYVEKQLVSKVLLHMSFSSDEERVF